MLLFLACQAPVADDTGTDVVDPLSLPDCQADAGGIEDTLTVHDGCGDLVLWAANADGTRGLRFGASQLVRPRFDDGKTSDLILLDLAVDPEIDVEDGTDLTACDIPGDTGASEEEVVREWSAASGSAALLLEDITGGEDSDSSWTSARATLQICNAVFVSDGEELRVGELVVEQDVRDPYYD